MGPTPPGTCPLSASGRPLRDTLVLPGNHDRGGVVAEVLPPKRKKLRANEASDLDAIIHGDAEAALGASLRLASWSGVATDEVPVRTGRSPEEVRSAMIALLEGGAREAGRRIFDSAVVEVARTLMFDAVEAFHREEPLRAGIAVELLRQTVPAHDEGRLADALLSEAVKSGSVAVRSSVVFRPGYEPAVTVKQEQVMGDLLERYRGAGLAPPMVSELPETVRDRDDLWPLLKLLERRGHLVALEDELFMDAASFSGAAERVATELGGATGLGPADFREVLPVTRKHLIPILTHFDQTGLTIRGPNGRDVAEREPN